LDIGGKKTKHDDILRTGAQNAFSITKTRAQLKDQRGVPVKTRKDNYKGRGCKVQKDGPPTKREKGKKTICVRSVTDGRKETPISENRARGLY